MCPFCISGAVLIGSGAISIGGLAGFVANKLHLTKKREGALIASLEDSVLTEMEAEAQIAKRARTPRSKSRKKLLARTWKNFEAVHFKGDRTWESLRMTK